MFLLEQWKKQYRGNYTSKTRKNGLDKDYVRCYSKRENKSCMLRYIVIKLSISTKTNITLPYSHKNKETKGKSTSKGSELQPQRFYKPNKA